MSTAPATQPDHIWINKHKYLRCPECGERWMDAKSNQCTECQRNDGEYNHNWRGGVSKQSAYQYKKVQVARYPDRVHARQAVANARRRGKIQDEPCILCGYEFAARHHYAGYTGENKKRTCPVCGLCHSALDYANRHSLEG